MLHCLRLKGIVGEPVSSWVRMNSGLKGEHLPNIIQGVYVALGFAYTLDVFHLDVRPGNIIVSGYYVDGSFHIKVMLSDWGCALKGTAPQCHFRG